MALEIHRVKPLGRRLSNMKFREGVYTSFFVILTTLILINISANMILFIKFVPFDTAYPPSTRSRIKTLITNATLLEDTEEETHILLILVGAFRTWASAQISLRKHLIEDGLCARKQRCIVHVVTHFSSSDNRPSSNLQGDAVVGAQVAYPGIDSWTHSQGVLTSKVQYLHYLVEPPYNIASPEEQAAMEDMEGQCRLGQLQGCD